MSVFDLYERESRIGGYGILLGVPGDNGRSDIKVSSTLDKKSLAAVVSIKMSFPAISMHAVRRHAIRKAQEESDRIRISNRKDLVLSRSEQMSTPLDRNMWAWTVCGAFLPRTKSGFSTLRFLESGYLICAAIELIQCAFGINDVCAMTDDYSKKAIMALRDLGAAQLNVILKVCAIANDEAVSAAGNVLDTIDRMRPVDVSVVPVGNSTVTSFTSAVDLGDSFLAIITPDGMLRVVSKHAEHVRQSPLDGARNDSVGGDSWLFSTSSRVDRAGGGGPRGSGAGGLL